MDAINNGRNLQQGNAQDFWEYANTNMDVYCGGHTHDRYAQQN